jgi:Ca2+-binding EF-hand superfamily protein
MLPPTTVPIQVIFQVNDRLATAQDLLTKELTVPITIKLQDTSDTAGLDQSLSIDNSTADRGTSTAQTLSVNVMRPALSAWERFELGEATALLVMEDPVRRGQINVLPRRFQESAPPRPATAWSYEKSVFARYSGDPDNIGAQCFEYDWKLSKLNGLIRNPMVNENTFDYLKTRYEALMMAQRQYAFFGFNSTRYAPGLLLTQLTEVLTDYGQSSGSSQGARHGAMVSRQFTRSGTTGAKLFNKYFMLRDADTIFIAASVMDKTKRKGLLGMPEKGLARFQFLEAFVRVAQCRYQDLGEEEDTYNSVRALWDLTQMGQELWELRKALFKNLLCEECDMVFKEFYHMLEAVYSTYKDMHSFPGRQSMGLSLGGWDQLLRDAEITETGVSSRDIGVAFALGKEFRPDESSSMRHMELSWPEFLVCLGAVMILRSDFEPEFFADMLADFFSDHISHARQGRLDGNSAGAGAGVQDAGMAAVLQLVHTVFEDADDDQSGSLSTREFRRAMAQPRVQQSMKDIGIPPEELGTLFSTIDRDGSGDVTLDELCEGFIKMKLSMRGADRAIAFFRKAFREADSDESGTLSLEEFQKMIANPQVLKRLESLGVNLEQVEVLFEQLCTRGNGANVGKLQGHTITADDLIAGFLSVREAGLGESRGVNFLRQVFLEADEDGSNSLSRPEMQKAFCSERVSNKLARLQLKEPDWMAIFDALDLDHNGTISWSELSQGMRSMWKQAIDDDIQAQAKKFTQAKTANLIPMAYTEDQRQSSFYSSHRESHSGSSSSSQKVNFDSKYTETKDAAMIVSASAETMTPAASLQSLGHSAP